MRKPRLAKSERARGGGRDIDDAPADERPAIDDPDDRAPAVIEIEHFHPGSKRESFVGCDQPAVMWILIIGSYTRFTGRPLYSQIRASATHVKMTLRIYCTSLS